MHNESVNPSVNWCALVPRLVHPTKVLVIEAMLWIDRPLSASELEKIFDGDLTVPGVSYHVRSLAENGVLRLVKKQKVRGAWKRIYTFSDAVKA